MVQYETGKQGFYQCSWDVLSMGSNESDDESDECCSLADSEDEEDTLHIPADRLSPHQRDRRKHRLARELASRGASRSESNLESSGSSH